MKNFPVTTSQTDDGSHKPFTVETLRALIEFLPEPPPDPLNGATVLWVLPELASRAQQIADAAKSYRHVHVQKSPHALENRIFGFRKAGEEPCLIIKLDEG